MFQGIDYLITRGMLVASDTRRSLTCGGCLMLGVVLFIGLLMGACVMEALR